MKKLEKSIKIEETLWLCTDNFKKLNNEIFIYKKE